MRACVNSRATCDTNIAVLLRGNRVSSASVTAGLPTSLITSVSTSHTHTLSIGDTQSDDDRAPERSVNDFQSLSQSPPLPRSQTSLCSSKNKIPPVKLSALRIGAFNAEANQKLDRDVKHTHSGKVKEQRKC